MGEHYDSSLREGHVSVNAQRHDGAYVADHSGVATIEFLLGDGAVVKKLAGDHKELFMYINETPNTTIDQQLFTQQVRETMIAAEEQAGGALDGASEEEILAYAQLIDPQVFVVDKWRLEEYAAIFADHLTRDIPSEQGDIEARRQTPAYTDAYKKALYAGWSYTFATAATLTDGTLPAYKTKS